jgi:hypothetical protein
VSGRSAGPDESLAICASSPTARWRYRLYEAHSLAGRVSLPSAGRDSDYLS